MKIKRTPSRFEKKAKRGFRGYPVGTIAFYGADESRASKVAVGIVLGADEEASAMGRWFSESSDVRYDRAIGDQVAEFLEKHGVRTVVTAGRIIGCPHEEGIDLPGRCRLSDVPLLGEPRPMDRRRAPRAVTRSGGWHVGISRSNLPLGPSAGEGPGMRAPHAGTASFSANRSAVCAAPRMCCTSAHMCSTCEGSATRCPASQPRQ